MSVGRSASLKIDWAKLPQQLGLRGTTAASLIAFKKRNDDARRRIQLLSEQATSVDFAAYRAQLKNGAVVDDMERVVAGFKPKTYDVGKTLRAIEAFEAHALKSAEETKAVVDSQLAELQKTLRNIEEARPFDQLGVDEVVAARGDIDTRTEELMSKGKWTVPGYQEKFGNLSVI